MPKIFRRFAPNRLGFFYYFAKSPQTRYAIRRSRETPELIDGAPYAKTTRTKMNSQQRKGKKQFVESSVFQRFSIDLVDSSSWFLILVTLFLSKKFSFPRVQIRFPWSKSGSKQGFQTRSGQCSPALGFRNVPGKLDFFTDFDTILHRWVRIWISIPLKRTGSLRNASKQVPNHQIHEMSGDSSSPTPPKTPL